mmetsp:Transcript_61363/g.126720  ORF Transcript_61363/g.126720 Transcript_61363/m.126720 type:complete len:429 (-) Transcript_61363:950-2236(-)
MTHPKLEHKKPQSQSYLHQDFGFLFLKLGCRHAEFRPGSLHQLEPCQPDPSASSAWGGCVAGARSSVGEDGGPVGEVVEQHVLLVVGLVVGPQVLHAHHALVPLVGGDEGDEARAHAVGVVECLAHVLLRLALHVDDGARGAQPPRHVHRLLQHLLVECGNDEVGGLVEPRNAVLHLQQLEYNAVSESKAHAWHLLLGAVEGEEAIVAAAAADGTQLPRAIEALEHDAGVVGKAADDGGVENQKVCKPILLGLFKQLRQLIQALLVDARPANRLQFLHTPRGHGLDDGLGGGLGDTEGGGDELLDHLLRPDLVQLVHHHAHRGELIIGNALRFQDAAHHLAGVDFDADVSGGDAHVGEERRDGRQKFRLRSYRLHSDYVHVPLVVLALAPPLRCLEPPALRYAEPLDGEDHHCLPGVRPLAGQDHACQ